MSCVENFILLCDVCTQGARDMRADPMLWEACREDADNVCKDVKPGGGRIQSCLVCVSSFAQGCLDEGIVMRREGKAGDCVVMCAASCVQRP